MPYRIQKSLAWIAKTLGIDRASSSGLDLEAPGLVPETIQPSIDALGWDRPAPGTIEVNQNLALGVQTVRTDAPPEGENWLVIAASALHDQAATHDLTLAFEHLGRFPAIALENTQARAQGDQVTLKRPFLLTPGSVLLVSSQTVVVTNLIMRWSHIVLPEGSYLPGSPYG